MSVGGFGQIRAPDADEQLILESVKQEIEQHLSRTVTELRALQVKTQVVAGVNYLIKAKADNHTIHVKINKPLPHTGRNPFVLALRHENLSEESPLEYFE